VSARRGQAGPSTYDRIYATVRRIPRGRVASYGQVATLAGLPGRARQVGYALAALRSSTAVPWHRVGLSQRLLLEREGVPFTADGRIPLERVGWKPRR
jgi:methylated-DNA-protein-cysteine methyltransferase related protein